MGSDDHDDWGGSPDPEDLGWVIFFVLFCLCCGLGILLSQHIGAYFWG